MAVAEKQGRIGSITHDSACPVYTFWDIGDTYNAVWFVQFIKEQIRLIDFFYDCEGKGLPAYSVMLQGKLYTYGGHYAPPDIRGSNRGSFQTGQYTLDVAKSLGIDFNVIEQVGYEDSVEAAKGIVPKCWFSPACSDGVSALQNWRKRKNEALSTQDKPVYFDEPVKDWTRHVGDAFRTLAVAYRYFEIGGRIMVRLSRR